MSDEKDSVKDSQPSSTCTGKKCSVEELKKTELEETDKKPPRIVSTEEVMELISRMAKSAAMKTIQDELQLFKGLISEAETTDEKLKIIREISDLKLRATGIVLANMKKSGVVQFPKPPVKLDG